MRPPKNSGSKGAALGKAATVAVGVTPASAPSSPSAEDITLHDGAPQRAAKQALPQRQLGRYLVLGELGRGGMGSVYEAFDSTLDRRVAVKILHRDVGWQHSERLRREAQALARLSHPNVVQVYEVGEAEGQTFIAMELVRGKTLRKWAEQQPRPSWRECVAVYLQAGQGLAAAHSHDLIHRDFKPSNAVMDDDGRVRVLDFGLAREAGEDSESPRPADSGPHTPVPASGSNPLHTPLTQTGVVMGTPAYMPLEQLRGMNADERSDQFAFCVALYEALYGHRPFEGNSTAALMFAVGAEEIRAAPRDSPVPTRLRQLVVRGLAAKPEDRWPSVDALLVELRRFIAPRNRRWLALGVAGGLGLVGVGLSRYAAVGFRCDGAEELLQGAWDDERRQQVENGIIATGVKHAPDTWERVELRLDEYADAWVAKQTEVCESTRVSELQSELQMELRMACLSSRRVALRETTEVLAKANASRVNQAVTLVDSLPGLSRCDDVDALGADVPPPEDPEVAREVDDLREQLDRARLLGVVGEYSEGSDATELVVQRAEALGYAPLQAEAYLQRGKLRDAIGSYTDALADVERAYLMAVEHRHEAVELDAVTELVHAVGIRQAKPDAGLQWSKTALALAREPLDEARVRARIGSILKGQGELELALPHQERALAIREEVLGPDHPSVASSLSGLASILRRQDKFDAALEHHRRALAIRERALGPRHPVVASSLNNMSNVLAEQGHAVEARAALERALSIREDALGPEHPKLVTILGNLGESLANEGDFTRAHALYRRALAISNNSLGEDHPRRISVLYGIGETYEEEGKWLAAKDYYEQALAGWERAKGNDHPDVARALVSLATVALARGDSEAARAHAERAVPIREASDASPGSMAKARFVLAQALWDDPSEQARARSLAERARGAYEREGDDARRAAVEAWLAERSARLVEPRSRVD